MKVTTISPIKSGKFTRDETPRLSRYAAQVFVDRVSGNPMLLSKLRPKGLTVDDPLRIVMQSTTAFLVSYIHELARKEPERAGNLAKLIEVPVLKRIDGKQTYIIEKQRLSTFLMLQASQFGEAAGEELSKMIYESKDETREPASSSAPSPKK